MKKFLTLLTLGLVAFTLNACTTASSVFSKIVEEMDEGKTNQKNALQSEYPEFTSKYFAIFPLKEGFVARASVDVRTDVIFHRIDRQDYPNENVRIVYNDYLGRGENSKELYDNYEHSNMATNTPQYKAFRQITKELGLEVKEYRATMSKYFFNSMPLSGKFVPQNNRGTAYYTVINDWDKIYIAYDKEGKMKIIFAYSHQIKYANHSTEQQMAAFMWFGTALKRAENLLNNDVLARYELR